MRRLTIAPLVLLALQLAAAGCSSNPAPDERSRSREVDITTEASCGVPAFNPATQRALFLYRSCGDGTWHLRGTAGGTSGRYSGRIVSDEPFTSVKPDSLESGDVLQHDAGVVEFTFYMSNGWTDGIDFAFPAGVDARLEIDDATGPILVGPDKVAAVSPIVLSERPQDACGSPEIDASEVASLFVWNDCGTGQWHVRATAGGGFDEYVGAIVSDRPLSPVVRYMLEANDVVETSEPYRIGFGLHVQEGWQDGFEFELPTDASATLYLNTGQTLRVGEHGRVEGVPYVLASASGASTDPDPTGQEVQYQSVSLDALPADKPLNNPGIGLEQAAKILNPTGEVHVNASVEAISTVRYMRLQWSLVEKAGDNVWNWAPLDAAIEQAVADGKQAAISLMGHTPVLGGTSKYTQAVPAWYMAGAEARGPKCTGVGSGAGTPPGCTYYRTDYKLACGAGEICDNLWTFNHNDPVYIAEQVELIEALRARYDNPAWAGKIAYVDVRGGLGSWTESHVDGVVLSGTNIPWPMPNWTGKKAIADAYLRFDHLPIIANMRNGGTAAEAPIESMWVYLCNEAAARDKVIGWRTDGIDCTKWLTDPVFDAYPEMEQCWMLGPVHGELCSGSSLDTVVNEDPWAAGTTGHFALNRRMAHWHMSGWNNKFVSYPGNAQTYGDAIDEWRAMGGYRLAVEKARLPSTVGVASPFGVEVEIVNSGTAPVYRDYYTVVMRLHPLSGGQDVLVPLQGDLTSVMPGQAASKFVQTALSVPTPGRYRVSVGVKQDPAYTQVNPLRLANAGPCAVVGNTYWCEVATMDVL